MTILLTRCPKCDENFMMADTEEHEGTCILCGCIKPFTKEELSEAETRRDKLSEEYISRMQRAYEEKDTGAMTTLAEEAASKGVSSWYAWFFIGWCHMTEGKIDKAFDDFELAGAFLDEESFDEFYGLVTDTCLDSILERCRKGEPWSGDCISLLKFSSTLVDRFSELMDCGFEEDLITKIGYLDEEIEDDATCFYLAFEASNIAVCYSCDNMYIPEHLSVTSSASWTVDTLFGKAKEVGVAKNVESMFPLMKEFLERLLKIESDICGDFGDEKMGLLCDYWIQDPGDVHEGHLADAFESFASYMVSNGRNKGQKKKMDAALSEYDKAIREALTDGRLDEMGSEEDEDAEEYDFEGRECPDCGRFIPNGPGGILECECGFRSRNVTKAMLDLPEDIGELAGMAEKALDGDNAELLFNLGSRILTDGEEPMGYLAVARSMVLDGRLPECVEVLSARSASLSGREGRMFYDRTLDIVGEGIAKASRDEDVLAMIALPVLVDNLERVEGGRFLSDLMDRVLELDGMKTLASASIMPSGMIRLMTVNMERNTSLESWKSLCQKCIPFMEKAVSNLESLSEDPDAVQESEDIKKNIDLVSHLLHGIESKIKYAGPSVVKKLEKEWRGKDVQGLFSDIILASKWKETKHRADSKEMLDAKNAVDAALVAYMKGPDSK